MHTRSLALSLLALSLIGAGPARAEAPTLSTVVHAGSLRPEWTVQPGRSGRASIVGYLYNRNILEAGHVWLRVERLGPDDEVTGTYRARLVGDVPSNDRLPFDVAVPEAAARYRVLVESVEWHDQCR
jgi:hypothetical protein